jgi:hypothetical protein
MWANGIETFEDYLDKELSGSPKSHDQSKRNQSLQSG